MSETDDLAQDSVASFGTHLVRLRLEAGNPTLYRLHQETGISRSVLSDAFGGKTLPTPRTVDALAQAFGADSAALLERRNRLARTAKDTAVSVDEPADAAPQHRVVRWRTAVLLAVGAFLVGVLGTGTAAALIFPAASAAVADPRIKVDDGSDPAATPCINDAKVAASETRAENTQLQIIWSDRCQAGWGRITRYDGKAEGNTVEVAIFPEPAPNGPLRQVAVNHGIQGSYTGLVVRPTDETRLCVTGSITVDGQTIDMGDPICI